MTISRQTAARARSQAPTRLLCRTLLRTALAVGGAALPASCTCPPKAPSAASADRTEEQVTLTPLKVALPKGGDACFQVYGQFSDAHLRIAQEILSKQPESMLLRMSRGVTTPQGIEKPLRIFLLNNASMQTLRNRLGANDPKTSGDGFYTQDMLAMSTVVNLAEFSDAFGHEVEHAASDYGVQSSIDMPQGRIETGDFLTPLFPALRLHRERQTHRLVGSLPLTTQIIFTTPADYFCGASSEDPQIVAALVASMRKSGLEKQVTDAMPRFFVSHYAFGGDRATHPELTTFSAEFWAECLMNYRLHPEVLRACDPVMFEVATAYDQGLRQNERAEVLQETLRQILERSAQP